uniref:T cell receptor beta variable 13 n=1 Tax=Ailuropoda melanoleuca TaxID=9646 RepID=A0A7N5JBV4_AILME
MRGPVLPESVRGTQLLCCVALCLLGAGPVGAEVIQTPRHLIQGRGGKAVLKCHPIPGHLSVSWYQQAPGQGLRFLIEYYNQGQRDKGDIPGRFSAQQFGNYSSQLDLSSLELGDSALYLCASS